MPVRAPVFCCATALLLRHPLLDGELVNAFLSKEERSPLWARVPRRQLY